MNSRYQSIDKLKGVLIVSCQADPGEPLYAPEHIAAMSLSALSGGASALRLEGVENVKAVAKKVVAKQFDVPIIGLTKIHGLSYDQRLDRAYITPTFEDAKNLAAAGADIIAIDATGRPRQDGASLEDTIKRIHNELDRPVMADVATLEQAQAAAAAAADLVSTTLFGYTRETMLADDAGPGLDLLKAMVDLLNRPVVMEGRVWQPEELRKAFELGAYAVVVGSAITRPHHITRRFVSAIPSSQKMGGRQK